MECRKTRHRSHSEFLVICGQFPERGPPLFVHLTLVLKQMKVIEANETGGLLSLVAVLAPSR
jgi:hypothetical protein